MSLITLTTGGTATYPRGATFGPRVLDTYEFVWINTGSAVAHLNAVAIRAVPGTLILSRPGMTDLYEWDRTAPTVHSFFHFSLGEEIFESLPLPDTWPLAASLDESDLYRPLLQHIADHFAFASGSDDAIASRCAEVILRLFTCSSSAIGAKEPKRLSTGVDRAISLMHARCRESPVPALSLADIANHVHLSPGHLIHLFNQECTTSPLDYFRQLRLERAQWLMDRSNMTIKEIAEAMGFANQFHFSRCFRQQFGMSPREYKRASDMQNS